MSLGIAELVSDPGTMSKEESSKARPGILRGS